MGDVRIKVAKDKAELVKALRAVDETTGPFQSYADVLIFAASLGIQKQTRKPITEYSKEIDPIRQDVFYGKGYDQVINLIGVADTNDPRIFADSVEAEEEKIKIFEEYANSGLEIISNVLEGAITYDEHILLLLAQEKEGLNSNESEFDLEKFL